MHRSFLLRALFLIFAMAGVAVVMVVTMRIGLGVTAVNGEASQTFFEQFVVSGGPIVWFVLLPMSFVMVYLAADYSLTICRKRLVPGGISQAVMELVQKFGAGQLQKQIADRDDFVSTAVVDAIDKGRGDWLRMRNALFESLEKQGLRLIRKIEWINLIGNISPMVGLFGTVFGMIKLFDAIVSAGGQPQPGQLAEGISVALVTTFWGLLIAIPALAIHGVFRNRIEGLISEAIAEAEIILPKIKPKLKDQGLVEVLSAGNVKQLIQELPVKPIDRTERSVPLR